MPDSLNFRVFTEPFKASMAEVERLTALQTAVGLKAVARRLVQAEKRLAPVYAGPNGITRKSLRVAKSKPSRNGKAVIGLLKFSVKQGRLSKGPEGARVVVGPGGGRVNLYKNKIERKYGFAAKAYDEVVPEARTIMSEAWAKALSKGV